jgi:hypothetical protein
MTVINLISPERLEQRASRHCLRNWAVRLIAGFSILAVAYGGLSHLAAQPSEERERLSSRHAHLQDRLQQAQNLIRERDRLGRARAAIGSIQESRPAGWFLEVMGEALTKDAYLVQFTLDRSRPGESGSSRSDGEEGGATLHLRGRAPGHRQVGEILRRLATSGAFAEVDLVSATEPRRGSSASGEIEFELLCTLTEEGTARW